MSRVRIAFQSWLFGGWAQDIKEALISHGRNFADCKCWDVLLDYLSFAFAKVDSLPTWDADSHNKVGWVGCAGGCPRSMLAEACRHSVPQQRANQGDLKDGWSAHPRWRSHQGPSIV